MLIVDAAPLENRTSITVNTKTTFQGKSNENSQFLLVNTCVCLFLSSLFFVCLPGTIYSVTFDSELSVTQQDLYCCILIMQGFRVVYHVTNHVEDKRINCF